MSQRRSPEPRTQGGFTLIELMIALVLFSFAVAGVLSVAVATTRAFREQRRAIKTENAARAPMDFLIDAIRGASPGVPNGIIGSATTCAKLTTGAISITDSTTAPDALTVVFAAGGVVTNTYSTLAPGDTALTVPSSANFAVGDTIMVTHTDATCTIADGKSCGTLFTVAAVPSATTVTLANACSAGSTAWPTAAGEFTSGWPKGSLVVRAKIATFTVGTWDGVNALLMDGEPVAEGVEDMQIAIGVDTADDGVSDTNSNTDEWIGNATGDTLPGGTYKIRAIKIVLVAQDTNALLGTPAFYRPTALNRTGSGTPDNYRRRVLSSFVEIRNLLGSP